MKNIHFMGIGGSGANAAAGIAHEMGYTVSGCDQKESLYAKNLERLGIQIAYQHEVSHLEDVDVVCVSPAFFEQVEKPEEFLVAQRQAIPVISWQQFMGHELQKGKRVIAVAGTKGKTTATSLVGQLLELFGIDPTVAVGSDVKKWGQNYRFGKSDWFVCEADEFNLNFHHYSADIAVITNIEMDHPEFFNSYEEYIGAYVEFVRRMKNDSTLILGIDSKGVQDLQNRISFYHGRIITYGVNSGADFCLAKDRTVEYKDSFAHFSVSHGMDYQTGNLKYQLHSELPGEHNALNLVAVFVVGQLFGVGDELFDAFISGAELPGRRFEVRGEYHGAVLVDDYAHNPMSVQAAIQAAKEKYLNKRIVAVWQPHMYSRTLVLFDRFTESFDRADQVIVLPIFASREKGSPLAATISHHAIGNALVERLGANRVKVVEGIEDAIELLKYELTEQDVVVNMGAGDNTQVIDALTKI